MDTIYPKMLFGAEEVGTVPFDPDKAKELMVPIFKNGELVYKLPSLKEIKTACAYNVSTLWPEVKRFDYPHQYYVDLSPKLMELKDNMLASYGHDRV